jgi:small subunit ribosomal protein S16
MSVKIRLQRHGRSKAPFYHVVVADSRAPRDGKFIEKIGSYLPQTQPATIDLDVNRAVYWLNNGAQPTDTCRALLSYKGALLKHHLEMGVAKGAITQEQADAKFETWVSDKANKVEQHKSRVNMSAKDQAAAKLADEAKANAARAEKIATKLAAAEAAIAAANAPAVEEVSATEEVPVTEEVPATEEAAAEATETPAE